MISVTLVGGVRDGAQFEKDSTEDVTFAEYEILPKIALRPDQQPKGNRILPLRTVGPYLYRYVFGAWVVEGQSATYVPA
jgi:hypothetical protein